MITFDVAISFAGEDREKAKQLVSCLKKKGVHVFYDNDYQANLVGKDLYQHLHKLYKDSALFFVPLISTNYIQKPWAMHELRAAQEREFSEYSEEVEYILPIKLDDTNAPGIPSTKGYLDMRKQSSSKIATIIKQKVEIRKSSDIFEKERFYNSTVRSFEFLSNRFCLLSQTSKAAEFAHLPSLINFFREKVEDFKNRYNESFYEILVQLLDYMKMEDDEHINGIDEKSLHLKQINFRVLLKIFKQTYENFEACKYSDDFDFWYFIELQTKNNRYNKDEMYKMVLIETADLIKNEILNPMTATNMYIECLKIFFLDRFVDEEYIDFNELLSIFPEELLSDYENSEPINKNAFDELKRLVRMTNNEEYIKP